MKRTNWTNEEVIKFLEGQKFDLERRVGYNEPIDDLIDLFKSFQTPETESGAMAYDEKSEMIVHIGPILPPFTPFSPEPPLDISQEDFITYVKSLKDGEKVIDCSNGAFYGTRGEIYTDKKDGVLCVMWSLGKNWGKDAGKKMGTSVTWGTRRIKDAGLQEND